MSDHQATEVDSTECFLDVRQIMEALPHRYPFLLVDKVLSVTPGESIRAIKNVTINEPFFPGHFPQKPVMPGVMILEAMAQATGILMPYCSDKPMEKDVIYYLVGMDNVRFKKMVEPGDQLLLEAHYVRRVREIWKFSAQAKVGGTVVCTADVMGVYKSDKE